MPAVVGVLGLGAMGSRIARRLLTAGHEVVVWNRTPERAADLVSAGAGLANTPVDAAEASDVVITAVTDGVALADVCTGANGLIAGLRSGSVLLDMSTVGPTAIHSIRSLLLPGVELVDAPVLGSLAEAEAGNLTIFAGATERGLARARPVLARLGTVLPVGPPGSGAAAKLVANGALFGCVALVGETLTLARVLGLSDDVGFDVLAATPLAAQAARRRPAIEANEFPPRFRLRLAAKDAALMLSESNAGAKVPMLNAVATWLHESADAGAGELDYSAMLCEILRSAESRR